VKILYVSQYFPPEMGAPAARVHELSREWVKLGHQVTVLTGFPNHPTGVIPDEYHGQLVRRETVDGICVVRVPLYPAANRGHARRALNYVSFGASASAVGPWLIDRPDVLVASSPQFFTAVAGYWLSRLLRVPWVFEVRDLWPRSIVELGAMKANGAIIRSLSWLERFLYRHADHIVTVTHSFVDEIAAHGIDPGRISVVTNGVDPVLFQPRDRADARAAVGLPGGFWAAYIGTHGMAHGLDMVLDAAARARDVRFLLVGEGAEKGRLRARAEQEGLANVTFQDQLPRDRVAQLLAAADVCLVLLRDKPVFRTVIPSKIFEYLAAGRAIVTTVDGESRRIVEDARAGVFSAPGDPVALARTLEGLARDPARLEAFGQAGRAHVVAHYSRAALAARYARLLAALVRT
jgi:putative colanic acid biosynthesis glycosyltransferase WcaI